MNQHLAGKLTVTPQQESEIAAKDAGCNAVTPAGAMPRFLPSSTIGSLGFSSDDPIPRYTDAPMSN
ncbi:MAG TPA: hypothetical protein VKY85_15665 [Candidatus Angelobacter sp.]|nr:hypothetical protein [Candidatus Angelobacter sp.]